MPRKIPFTKIDLIRALSAKADISQTKVEIILDALAEFAYAGASAKRGFSIPGIGRVCVIRRRARKGFNITSGRLEQIPARAALAFRFSEFAKAAILPAVAKLEVNPEIKVAAQKPAATKNAAKRTAQKQVPVATKEAAKRVSGKQDPALAKAAAKRTAQKRTSVATKAAAKRTAQKRAPKAKS